MMARERWSDEDRIKLMRVSEEVAAQYPEMLAEDRHAIVASKISRDGFRPTANAVASMISNLQRARAVPQNGVGHHIDELPGLQALDEIKEEVSGWTDYFDAQFTRAADLLHETETRGLELHKAQMRVLERIATILDGQSAILNTQVKMLDKLNTGIDVLCDQMNTLVTGLRETENG